MKKMRYISSSVICLLLALLLQSCVQNMLPAPVYVATITSIKADGALDVKIDNNSRCVTFNMDEVEDLAKVNITSCHFNNDTVVSSNIPIVGVHDLTVPKTVILRSYQDYEWKLTATQTITRNFSVESQTGDCIIDEVNHSVMVKVTKSTSLTSVKVISCKLGPRDITTYSENPLEMKDFSFPRTLLVKYRDIEEKWVITVTQSTMDVEMGRVSPRTHSCHFEANAPQGTVSGFVMRRKGDAKWSQVDSLVRSSGKIVGVAVNLEMQTEYECRAFSGKDTTSVSNFTTDGETQLPNSGMEEISNTGNYVEFYNPSSTQTNCKSPWWGSGNGCSSKGVTGSADMGFVICDSDSEIKAEGARSARLQSAWAVVKFAAGNLFSGEFAGLVGIRGGKVNFGRPFTNRPKALSLMIKYENGPINHVDGYPKSDPVKIGDPDRARVYIALGTWDAKTYGGTDDSPVQINTTQEDTFFNPEGPAVIAYGSFMSSTKITEWTKITIPLVYKDDFTVPTHIIVSCAASWLGDYFTGYSGSKLWVDDFRLEY